MAAGYVLSALGLFSGGFGVVRWLAAFAGIPLSATTLAVSLTVGLLLTGAGFSLLVVGSDPFADETWVRAEPDFRPFGAEDELHLESPERDVPTGPGDSDSVAEAGPVTS